MTDFGIIGRGWRADFYLELARVLPDRFRVVGVVTRDAARGDEITARWGVPTYRTAAELVAAAPAFVVTSVPRDANPGVIEELVAHGMPVLSETPPAADVPGLFALWDSVGASGLVQVAEQYPLQPLHSVRRDLARLIGTATSASVSSTHDYHAVALLRSWLDVGFTPATVVAQRFTESLLRGPDRSGWPEPELVTAHRTVATLSFGDRVGSYDFTDGQWWHPLRSHRHVLRGTHGEIVDDEVVRMADARTPVRSRIERRQTGIGSNLEGFALDALTVDGAVVWRNPYFPARLSDEEIAIARCLDLMAAWVDGGPPLYPLAEACQDHLLSLAIAESWRSGRPVTTEAGPWAAGQPSGK
ncbi:gfo/Idh/MocA family oxidoreductase [Lentzea tibetensis]|uniref:Gfo/Idh/MocA family oxidoreductase n=1 Tax=Lentzea tibetensis TaxID=2591470 RepID=A0A563F2R3_9PSEU|nr:Gfo/Idh/MocA family oxidoreductase [Lentzea tibetensis]TWP54245.1 gfo/Idh/MocA family oxidoreductase [Lentzea tibetensis]